ncbi:hypothetical protein BBP40_009325 [Aspergillus hancockii]|nr:hypothetical protein BBP40_009325 [Aspergillus hancockii]
MSEQSYDSDSDNKLVPYDHNDPSSEEDEYGEYSGYNNSIHGGNGHVVPINQVPPGNVGEEPVTRAEYQKLKHEIRQLKQQVRDLINSRPSPPLPGPGEWPPRVPQKQGPAYPGGPEKGIGGSVVRSGVEWFNGFRKNDERFIEFGWKYPNPPVVLITLSMRNHTGDSGYHLAGPNDGIHSVGETGFRMIFDYNTTKPALVYWIAVSIS